MTEEEKKQKLAELRERMAAKKAVKAKEEAKETIANEAIRRKSGKVRRQHCSQTTSMPIHCLCVGHECYT